MKDLFVVWKSGTSSRYSVPASAIMKDILRGGIIYLASDDVHGELYLDATEIASAVLTSGGSVSAEAPAPEHAADPTYSQ